MSFHTHQNARCAVFSLTRARGIGTLMIFVVRKNFSQPERLRATMRELAAKGLAPEEIGRAARPVRLLVHQGDASSVPSRARRAASAAAAALSQMRIAGEVGQLPPVTSIVTPVTKSASLDARKQITLA